MHFHLDLGILGIFSSFQFRIWRRLLLSYLISSVALPFSTKFAGILVQTNDLHFVIVFLNETAQRKAETFVRPHAPIHGVQGPWRQVFVDFLAFAGG